MPFRPFRKRAPSEQQAAAGRILRELFERHAPMVHAICRLELRNRHDAEDATQQTFLAAYRSLLGGHQTTNPPAWLATIARNECSRVRNRAIVTVPIDDSEGAAHGDVTSAVEQREELEALSTALSGLSPAQRDAVVLREFYGLSYDEVSAALGVSGSAVESLLFKGRRRLQEKLGSLRAAGAVLMPDTIRDALVQLVPGFGGGSAASALPAAAKVAAVAVAVTSGGVTVVEHAHRDPSRPPKEIASTEHPAKLESGDRRRPARAPEARSRTIALRSAVPRVVSRASVSTQDETPTSTRNGGASNDATRDDGDEATERDVEPEDGTTAGPTGDEESEPSADAAERPERADDEHDDVEREEDEPENEAPDSQDSDRGVPDLDDSEHD